VLASAVLVAGLVTPAGAAGAAENGAGGAAEKRTAQNRAAPGRVDPVVACPITKPPPLPGAKPQPKSTLPPPPSPPDDAEAVGGDRLASPGLVVPSGVRPLPAGLTAHSWVIADLDTGDVIAACAPHAYHAPASTQKLLTALTVLPKVNPKQVITVTPADLAFEPGSSAVGLVQGGHYTVETVLLGLLLVSGNDAANVIARLAGGARGVPGTLADMNAEAARIGALDTHAVTPSGLDSAGQWTSAYDLALIARADFARPDFRRYTATPRAQIPAQPPKFPTFQIQNDNKLLGNYPGAIGGKTGYTDFAKHTYVGAAQRNGRRLVVTMMDGEGRPTRLWQQAATLLDWGFAVPDGTEGVGHLVSPGEVSSTERSRNGGTPRPAVTGAAAAAESPEDGKEIRTAAIVGGAVAALLLTSAALVLLVWRTRRLDAKRRRPTRPGPPSR